MEAPFAPLLSSLDDVQVVLALDKTSEGLKLAETHAEKAREETAAASDALDDLASTLSGGASGGDEDRSAGADPV